MQMIRPVDIDSDGLESTTAEAEAYPQWEADGVPYFSAVIASLSFSDAGILALCTESNDLYIYDHSIQEITHEIPGGGGTRRLMWNESSDILVAASSSDVYFYDASTFELIATDEGLYPSNPTHSPTGDVMCYFDSDPDEIVIYDTASRSEVAREEIETLADEIDNRFYTVIGAAWDDDNETVFISLYGRTLTASGTEYERGVIKWNYSSGATSDVVIASGSEQGEIACEKGGSRFALYTGGELQIRSKSDLSIEDSESLSSEPGDVVWSEEQNRVLLWNANSPRYSVYNPDQNEFEDINDIESDFFDVSSSAPGPHLIDASDDIYAAGCNNEDGSYGFRVFDASTRDIIDQTNPEFAEDDRVIYEDRIYQALTDTTDRPDNGEKADPATWVDQGYINPLRMFDGSVGSQTTADDVLEVSIKPSGGQVNAFALFNLEGANLRITMTDPDGDEYYDSGEIALLDESTIDNWWAFFFEPYIQLPDQAITEVPPYVDGTINITVDALGSEAAIGELVMGSLVNLGRTQYGSSVGIEDYSRKDTDQFGNFDVVERGYSNSAEYDIHIEPFQTPGIKNLLAKFRATPAVYIGSPDRPSTIVYGYYRDFSIVLSSYSIDECTIEVEGLQ